MAYADNNTSNRKLGAGAAVLMLEAGLAWAVIAGLTMTITRRVDPKINTFTVPEVKPTVTPEQPKVEPQKQPEVARPPLNPIVELAPTGPATHFADDALGDGAGTVIELPRPEPSAIPSPRPSFAPKAAHPKGKTGGWVTTNDYPTSDLRGEHEGTTRYRLAISADGRVTECSVTASSGFAGLDRAACDNLKRRAQFDPASDETGARSAGSFSGSVIWRIPEE